MSPTPAEPIEKPSAAADSALEASAAGRDPAPCTLQALSLYFLRLGAVGFGGPIALVGYMQRDLVEKRRWISEAEYKEGLALAQLAPGPLAAQVAIYLGWVRGGTPGATLVGAAFVLPSFVMVLALSIFYVHAEGLGWMQGAFYGIGAAVIAVIARSAVKLVKMTLARDPVLWALFGVNALVTAWTESESAWVFVASGLVALAIRGRPAGAAVVSASLAPMWPELLSGLQGPASGKTLLSMGWFFAKAGAFVFGSGLAIVPFLRGGVVERYGWLSDRQFLDAVAVAMITPGPVVITVAFIGYLVAGFAGSVVAALGTFLPCYLLVVLPARSFRKWAKNPRIRAFVDGVTAAATGAIAGAAFVLGRRAIHDMPTALIGAATLGALFLPKKVPEPLLILTAGLIGVGLKTIAP